MGSLLSWSFSVATVSEGFLWYLLPWSFGSIGQCTYFVGGSNMLWFLYDVDRVCTCRMSYELVLCPHTAPGCRNLYGLGMSYATTASPKPSSRASWRVGHTIVGREYAGWTTSKSGHTCPCQNCSEGSLAAKTGRGSWLKCPSCPRDDPISQGTALNWTALCQI